MEQVKNHLTIAMTMLGNLQQSTSDHNSSLITALNEEVDRNMIMQAELYHQEVIIDELKSDHKRKMQHDQQLIDDLQNETKKLKADFEVQLNEYKKKIQDAQQLIDDLQQDYEEIKDDLKDQVVKYNEINDKLAQSVANHNGSIYNINVFSNINYKENNEVYYVDMTVNYEKDFNILNNFKSIRVRKLTMSIENVLNNLDYKWFVNLDLPLTQTNDNYNITTYGWKHCGRHKHVIRNGHNNSIVLFNPGYNIGILDDMMKKHPIIFKFMKKLTILPRLARVCVNTAECKKRNSTVEYNCDFLSNVDKITILNHVALICELSADDRNSNEEKIYKSDHGVEYQMLNCNWNKTPIFRERSKFWNINSDTKINLEDACANITWVE